MSGLFVKPSKLHEHVHETNGPAHVSHMHKSLLASGDRGLKDGIIFHLHLYIMSANSEGSGESAH